MPLVKLDIWKNKEGLTALIMSGDIGEEARQMLDDDYEIIHSITAESHFDAMTQYYAFMNWGSYETEFDVDKQPYDLESLRRNKDQNKP